MDYDAFVSKEKTKLIAPAGYGKTFTIAECLEYTKGKQLILTHTNAGVASIKEKIASNSAIKPSSYNVETISSFAQRYVINLYNGDDIPEQNDKENYHLFIIEKATDLFSLNNIQDVIKASYSGLFIDEYQDCTKAQHTMLMRLADILPTHILGDPLQGIFDFNGELVDFEFDLNDFEKFPPLDIPWRWNNAENPHLGKTLKEIRRDLEKSDSVDFSSYVSSIDLVLTDEGEKYEYGSNYNKKTWSLVNRNVDSSILILEPTTASVDTRVKFNSMFKNSFRLIESIDDKDFYLLSKDLDTLINNYDFTKLINILNKLFSKSIEKDDRGFTGIKHWFNDKGCKNKKAIEDKSKAEKINPLLEYLNINCTPYLLFVLIKYIRNTLKCKCYRKELLSSILKSLENAHLQNISVYEAMVQNRNNIRRVGRKIYGKCIGTTLLTKGLEFDTVVILDAHKFKDKKNLYVALTRCCKELVVFTKNNIINFK